MMKGDQMKKFFKAAITALMVFGAINVFADDLGSYPEVRDALNNDDVALFAYQGYLEEGYQVAEKEVSPISYVSAPRGVHKFAAVSITMQKNNSAEQLTFTIDISNDGKGNLAVANISVQKHHD